MNSATISRITEGEPEKYATMTDFCRLFEQDMSGLYQLSLLLTGDHEKAEQCFAAGLEDSVKESLVFKQWAQAWAKRMILVNAIRMIAPRPYHAINTALPAGLELDSQLPIVHEKDLIIASVLRLADFERFVFVMSVLERLADEDCSTLLDCSLHELREARARALQQIAQSYTLRAGAAVEALTH